MSNVSTYLSVDIDYWSKADHRLACSQFIRRVLRLGVPTLVVSSHEAMLGDVDRSGCRRIEHVDYHSDVADYPEMQDSQFAEGVRYKRGLNFEDGTWLSFVRWRKRGELLWRFPERKCYDDGDGWGTCHSVRNPFEEDCSGWAKIDLRKGLRGILWHDVSRVGIAISYDYWGHKGGAYAGVLADLLGTRTFEQAVRMAKQKRLGKKGRRRIHA